MKTFPDARLIQTNGIRLAVHEAGEGQPLVLCHGWPEQAYSWRYQVEPLVQAGYRVIVPEQRGYGKSDKPEAVEAYDARQLSRDLTGLLDHYGYDQAIFIGHDWGAINVWNLSLLYPERVKAIINLSVPYLVRGETDWVTFWEQMLGPDFYIVHFNRQPGVAEQAFEANVENFLRNMYRTDFWNEAPRDPGPGMALINLAQTNPEELPGHLMMQQEELDVFVEAFKSGGFTAPINWYRNFTRNWQLLADVPEVIDKPTLMIHGKYDMVPALENLTDYVPAAEVHTLPCGHWIQQEKPDETNALILDWLDRQSLHR